VSAIVALAALVAGTPASAAPSGAYMVIEIDHQALRRQQLENLLDQVLDALHEASIEHSAASVEGGTVVVALSAARQAPHARNRLESSIPEADFVQRAGGLVEGQLTLTSLDLLARQATLQTREVIARRMQDSGLIGSVSVINDDRVRIETADAATFQTPRSMLPQQGRFTFHLVRANGGESPTDAMTALPYFKGDQPESVQRRPIMTGERLLNANPSRDEQTGEFVVSFRFDAEGTRVLCEITREQLRQRFAILFDGRVLTAPLIAEAICGGSGQITGNFTAQSATDLAVLLSSGALPAPVRIIEEGQTLAR
jgi:protein-export membrane protein SecD